MKGQTVTLILTLLMCSALISAQKVTSFSESKFCQDLQKVYTESYKQWVSSVSFGEKKGMDLGSYSKAEAALITLALNDCDTTSLPLISPIPMLVNPTQQQLTCNRLRYKYLEAHSQWITRVCKTHRIPALLFIEMQYEKCEVDALPSLRPVPKTRFLDLECPDIRKRYEAAYLKWATGDEYSDRQTLYVEAGDYLLQLSRRQCDLSGLEIISPVPDFIEVKKSPLGQSFLTRRMRKASTNSN